MGDKRPNENDDGLDLVSTMIGIAWKAHLRGELSHDEMLGVLKDAINCRAVENDVEAPFPNRPVMQRVRERTAARKVSP